MSNLKKRDKKIIGLILLNVFIFSGGLIFDVKAQEYSLIIEENDEYIWGIEEINATNFKNVFGFDPNFGEGDLFKMIIRNIGETFILWIIQAEIWDYGSNWDASGSVENFYLQKNPAAYDDGLFIPLPADIYLQEFVNYSSEDYYLIGFSLYKHDLSDTGQNYTWQKEFNSNGVMITEAYFDQYDNVIVRLKLLEIKIVSPSASDKLITNNNFTIRWNTNGPMDRIIIELHNTMLGFLRPITDNFTENDGEFIWDTGSLNGDNYYLKIINYDITQIFDVSEQFSIVQKLNSPPVIPGYALYLLIGSICVISVFLIQKQLKS